MLPVTPEDLQDFLSIEAKLELPAEALLRREDIQAAGDGLIEAADAYADQGYLLKAGVVKRRAATAYAKVGRLERAAEDMVDAIALIRQADQLSKLSHELLDTHLRYDVIRANYPNLYMSFSYKQGEVGVASSSYVCFEQMKNAYAWLMLILAHLGENKLPNATYMNGRADLYAIDSDLAAEHEYQRRLLRSTSDDWAGDLGRAHELLM